MKVGETRKYILFTCFAYQIRIPYPIPVQRLYFRGKRPWKHMLRNVTFPYFLLFVEKLLGFSSANLPVVLDVLEFEKIHRDSKRQLVVSQPAHVFFT